MGIFTALKFVSFYVCLGDIFVFFAYNAANWNQDGREGSVLVRLSRVWLGRKMKREKPDADAAVICKLVHISSLGRNAIPESRIHLFLLCFVRDGVLFYIQLQTPLLAD